jgi:hypothetical protein
MAAHYAFFMFITQNQEAEMLYSSSRILHNWFFYFLMETFNTLCTLMARYGTIL